MCGQSFLTIAQATCSSEHWSIWSQWSIPIMCSWCSCIKPWEKRSEILPLVFHPHLTCNMLKTHPTGILFCVLGRQHHASSTCNSALLFSNSNCASRSAWRDVMLAWFWVSSGRLGARNSWNYCWPLTLSNRFKGKNSMFSPAMSRF